MRLFKFLVIHNKLIEKSEMIRPVLRIRMVQKDGKLKPSELLTKNKFFFYCCNLDKINEPILTQHNIIESKSGMVLMSIDYPNELVEFKNNNKSYVIIDAGNVDEVMNMISPVEYKNGNNFQGCSIKDCSTCTEISKTCRRKNLTINIDDKQKYVRGNTWSFVNDKVGTRNKVTENLDGAIISRTIEPRTGGIAYSSLQWENGNRPKELKKPVNVSLHHWIKCKSIPVKPVKDTDYSFYHIGHIFDYRDKFIGLETQKEQKELRKEKEPKLNIHRGMRVLGGQNYYSKDLNCDCSCGNEDKLKCRECEGVLYIDTEQRLVDLYNQLVSEEYKQLAEII